MLGEKMGHASAQTQLKVLPAKNGAPQLETTATGTGTFLGVESKSCPLIRQGSKQTAVSTVNALTQD